MLNHNTQELQFQKQESLNSLKRYNHDAETVNLISQLITNNVELFTTEVQLELNKYFPGLLFQCEELTNSLSIDIEHVSSDQVEYLISDLTFYTKHPAISLHNICSRLDNYRNTTDESKQLFENPTRLIDDLMQDKAKGIFLSGQSGIGKSHIINAIAKELSKKGFLIHFITPETVYRYKNFSMAANALYLFDNYNNPYNSAMSKIFLASILTIHNTGQAKLLVTSNLTLNNLLKGMLATDSNQLPRYTRRANELFSSQRDPGLVSKNHTIYEHPSEKVTEIADLVKKHAHLFTQDVQKRLQKHFPGLLFTQSESPKTISLELQYVATEQLADLKMDLAFFVKHPTLPLENICSRMNNYTITTKEHQALYDEAKRLIDPSNLYKGDGGFWSGAAGIGKSHITIAVAKIFSAQGFVVYFITPETANEYTGKVAISAKTLYVLDDFNNPYEATMRDIFLQVIINSHEHGGKVIVTSNQLLQKLLPSSLTFDSENLHRYTRRANELFNKQNRFLVRNPNQNTSEINKHDDKKVEELSKLIKKNSHLLTKNVQEQFKKYFPGLTFIQNKADISMDLQYVTPKEFDNFKIDLTFYIAHPALPLENICSRLDNYEIKNETNQQLLEKVGPVVDPSMLSIANGALLIGDAGIGKSHITISVAKKLFERGFSVYFVLPGNVRTLKNISMGPKQVWIFDDYNNPYDSDLRNHFIKVLDNAQTHGMKILLSANRPFDTLLRSLFAAYGGPDEHSKYRLIADDLFVKNVSNYRQISQPLKVDKELVGKKINIRSFDFDGCVFNRNYILSKTANRLIEENQQFITDISLDILKKNYAEVVFMVGSNRQSFETDFINAKKGVGSCFPALIQLCEEFQRQVKEITCRVDKYLLSDSYGNTESGYNFNMALKNDANSKFIRWLFDDSKITVLYAQIHKIATDYPEAEITFDFYDDRYNNGRDILQGLADFFDANPDLIPHNVTLQLHYYAGDAVKNITIIQGIGLIDTFYQEHLHLMIASAGLSYCDNLNGSHHVLNELTREGCLKQFKNQRLVKLMGGQSAITYCSYTKLPEHAYFQIPDSPRTANQDKEEGLRNSSWASLSNNRHTLFMNSENDLEFSEEAERRYTQETNTLCSIQ